MWWEIIPSFTIITTVLYIPSLAGRALNRAIHDGNPVKRDYTQQTSHGVLYHFRDVQHSQPSFWQKYVKVRVIVEIVRWNLKLKTVTVFRLTSRATELFTRATLLLTSTRMEDQFL